MGCPIMCNVEQTPHPKFANVSLRHFYCSQDNDRLSNMEVTIPPGVEISEHIHDNSTEFYYVVRGVGSFFTEGGWHEIGPGDAFKAPVGTVHAVKCTGAEPLILFSTFSPPLR